MGAFDDLIPSSGGGAFDDLLPQAKKPSDLSTADTAKSLGLALIAGPGEGVARTEAGLGTFLQAPAANALSGVVGARALVDRGLSWLLEKGGGDGSLNADIQDDAQVASRYAAQQRADNIKKAKSWGPGKDPLTSSAVLLGEAMQNDGRDRVQSIQDFNREENPELMRQQKAQQDAKGFLGNLKAIADNPIAFAHTMAQSAPDMAAGAGVAKMLAVRGLAGAAVAGEEAAAAVLKAGGDATAQAAAAKAAIEAVQAKAVAAASTGGALSEAASSSYGAREGAYQQVAQMPVEQLQQGSERFRQILAKVGDPLKAREILANELADQTPMLTGAGTVAGTLATNKLFGGDATANTIAGVQKLTPKVVAKDVLQEGGEEVLQGIPEDVVSHGAMVQADPKHELDIGGSIAQNFVAGAAMGSGGHGLAYAHQLMADSKAGTLAPDKSAPIAPTDSTTKQPVAPANNANAATNTVATSDTSAAEKALHTPVELTTLDRVNDLDKRVAELGDRTAELSDKNGYGPMFDQERQEVASQRAELEQERLALTKDWPKAIEGKASSFTTEAGARVEAKYALMDAADLVTSHDEGLRKNPAYPPELQPRARDRAASEMQVSGIVQKLDPARLGLSADAANGAPIVGADGLVESGNARTIALKRVYQANGQKASDYKQFLRDNADQFGITPESVDNMQKPVLVRVRTTPVNRAEFARQANASTVAMMSPSEQAKSDASRIESMEDLTPDDNGDFANVASKPFVRRFMARLPATEQAGMIDASGNLSTSGYARVRNAVLAKAYGDSPVLARMTESMDDNLRNVSKALILAAPKVAQMREAVGAGTRFDADITPDLMSAVEELSRLKESGTSVEDALAQAGMFGDETPPEVRQLLKFLADNLRRPRRIAEFITNYMEALDAAGDPNQGSLLGEVEAPAKQDLLKAAERNTQNADRQGNGLATPAENTKRPVAAKDQEHGAETQGQQTNAKGDQVGPGRDGSSGEVGTGQRTEQRAGVEHGNSVGEKSEWVDFPKDSGTIGIPRADMPQIKGEHRGALIQFLQGRGIEHKTKEVQASTLKPTQAEFSTKKAARWSEIRDTAERSVLVSSDGHILDGHHQWVAALAANEPVKAIVLDAPIRELMANVFQFPSVVQSQDSATAKADPRKLARQDFKQAMAELADLVADTLGTRVMMMPPNNAKLRVILVKLFDSAIRVVGTDLKAATKWVKAQLKADPDTKPYWNKITDKDYQTAALAALEQSTKAHVDDLFSAAEKRQADLFSGESEATKLAMIDGRAYDAKRDNFTPLSAESLLSKEALEAADAVISKYPAESEGEISAEDRARAEKLLEPVLEKASEAKADFDQKIIDIARKVGALGQQLAPLKGLKRGAVKLVEENFDVGQMKDLLRSTIVVEDYADAQKVMDAIESEFKLLRAPKNRTGDVPLRSQGKDVPPEDPAKYGGYSDIMVNVVMPNGTIAEIQINVPVMLSAKAGQGHALYDRLRSSTNGSERYSELHAASIAFYSVARDAFKNSASVMLDQREGQYLSGLSPSQGDFSSRKKMRPSGNSTYERSTPSPSDKSIPNLQPGGKTSGTLISSSFKNSVAEITENGYSSGNLFGARDGNDTDGAPSTQGQGAGPVQGTTGKGDAERARGRPGRANLIDNGGPDAGPANAGEVGQAGTTGVRGQDENGKRSESGDSDVRSAGVPAGRDIPAKSGLNYEFGPDDLTYEGSWPKKAAANVEAVELLQKLEAEGRQATREEQKVLAKFIGWGSSEMANNLFGAKLDKAAKALEDYAEAIAAMGSGTSVTNSSYVKYSPAFRVLQAKNPALTWYSAGTITKDMLDKAKPDAATQRWLALRDRLKAVLSAEEWAEASRSTQYAHYTSKAIVKSMWSALERMGFKGGSILEPGAGIGVFPGLMTPEVATNSAYTGIEFDGVTGRILKQLFPDERILVESFVDSKLPKNYYDVAVGNPPFSGTKILGDPEYAKHAFSLHDYFFAKSLDRVKPGGLVVYVTSRYTMDKLNDKARQYLADRADLVGAIRLPQTAFKQNAGTDVVTDVIFLRKKVPGEAFSGAQDWAKSTPIAAGSKTFPINEYFHNHPEMVLGKHSDQGKMQNSSEPQYTVEALPGDIEEHFAKAVASLPENVYRAERGSSAESAKVREIDFNPKAQKEGNYYVTDAGVLMVREGGVGVRVQEKQAKNAEVIKDFVPLRDALKQAHYDQLNDGPWEQSLAALQKAYAAFTKAQGFVNQFTTKMVNTTVVDEETGEKFTDQEARRTYTLLKKIEDDPDWTLVAALENVNDDTGAITPGKFLSERVLGKPAAATVSTPTDALLSVLNDVGHVDLATIAGRLNISQADAIEALGTAIYEDPESGWTTADEYTSGNVKKKLESARAAAKTDKAFERNVAALEAAQPDPKTPNQINASLGMNWIPGSTYSDFLREVAGVNAGVEWNARTKQWIVEERSGGSTLAATADWGTDRRNATNLLEHALTGRKIQIESSSGTGKDKVTFTDTAAIEAANEKMAKLQDEFQKWLWKDADRTASLVRSFNDKFNTTVPRAFDGSHLTLPGSSTQYHIFDHVKRGAWRIIARGNTYLAHAVGSGKTFQMVISAMEQKRLGLIKKPMMVVPNHMLQQFAREWQDLYPAARLMVADENNFHMDNRRRFVSRVALSDLDGVVITQSAFKILDLDPEFKKKMIQQQLDYMRAALEEAGGDPDKIRMVEDGVKKDGTIKYKLEGSKSRDPKIKQIEKQIENMEQKLIAATSSVGKDQNARFDELGVDFLYVDEAHNYRKLDFTTNRDVKGLSPTGSGMAFDLYMKSRYLEEKTPGRSLVMASGTPVTNTVAELYSVQKFMDNQALVDRGIEDFDSWAAMFGREKTALEPNAAGKYEPVTRFSKFVNVPELTQMFREYADVLNSDHLAALLGDKRPKVEGGSRKIIVTPKTDAYADYQSVLAQRVKDSKEWKPTKDQPNNPDPIIKIIGDGRLAAIDMRFMDPSLPSDPDSKLNRLADDVIQAFKETSALEYNDKSGKAEPNKGASMMVFSDLGFGAGVAASRGFNARAWLEKRLRDAGVPMDQVAFMSDYKKSSDKLKLFKDVNAGRVRALVGSSKNMGTGVNAQQRLAALFHLDSPWYPADLEQREGRIVRQGNKNPLVKLFAYAAKGTYDENMWKMLASKQFFIDQALSGDSNLREIEDLDSQSQYDLAAAMVADDPRILQLAGAKADIEKMQRLYQAHEQQRMGFVSQYSEARATIAWANAQMKSALDNAGKVVDLSGTNFVAKAGGKTFTVRSDWAQALIDRYKDLAGQGVTQTQSVGEISGFKVAFAADNVGGQYMARLMLETPEQVVLASDAGTSLVGMSMRATNTLASLSTLPAKLRERINEAQARKDALETRLETPFPMAELLAGKIREADALEREIIAGDAVKQETGFPWETLSDDDYAAGAGMGAVGEMYLSRGQGGGMDLKALKALAYRIRSNMLNMPDVHVYASPLDLPASAQGLRDYIKEQGAEADVEGAMHNGALYLFASGLSDALRAEHVLAEHEAAHFGLRAILGASLKTSMLMIYNNNTYIRQLATELQKRGKLSNAAATEEAIVDIPTSRLVKLHGWRRVVLNVRDWLQSNGFESMAAKIGTWLDGNLSDQQRADMFVANLVRAAREFVTGKREGKFSTATGTMLSGTLADDIAKQEKWLSTEAKVRGYKDIDQLAEKDYALFEKLAALWRQKNPADNGVLLSRQYMPLVSAQSALESAIETATQDLWDSLSSKGERTVSLGRTPHVLAMVEGTAPPTNLLFDPSIQFKSFKKSEIDGGHASAMDAVEPADLIRGIYRPAMVFDTGNGEYVFVTNTLTPQGPVIVPIKINAKDSNGNTVAKVMSAYPRERSRVADWINGKVPGYKLVYADKILSQESVTGRSHPENKNPASGGVSVGGKVSFNVPKPNASTTPETLPNTSNVSEYGSPVNGNYTGWSNVAKTLQAKWDGAKINGKPQPRLKDYGSLLAWIDKHYKGDAADKPMFSRAPLQGTAAERAEKIIQTNAATAKPLDVVARTLTKITGLERLTGAIYDRAGYLLDRFTPENVKAGMVADYGVPGAVIDQRALMQGRQRVQLRQAGTLIDKLSTLTRAESRVAYEWMNETDPHQVYTMMHNLPEESVKVLTEVQAMIDKLSKEAVRMGQLSAEAYERNKFAYLRRSYAKYTLEQTPGEKASRARAISILGEQYKGRGLTEAATMEQIKNAAPEWWQRKMVAGKADTSLKGEKLVRLERRAPSGERVGTLPGVDGNKAPGKLLEVNYYPADLPLPAKYADWNRMDTFEVRDTKGDKAILWRDFTKDEREKMGEIDEARFAIAKTLHGMIHDVEVGRYLEWLAHTQAKKEGETIPGTVVNAENSKVPMYLLTFKPGEWVRVPESKIEGTNVMKYGTLAGRYLPGPVWNDLRQTVNGQFKPFGETYAKLLSWWKTSKTALSPAVHTNNIMSNFVMADWHDVTAGHTAKALRILMGSHAMDGKGALGTFGNKLAGAIGSVDRDAAREIVTRYQDSGGDIGSWATNEIAKSQIDPMLEVMEKELAATNGNSTQAQAGVYQALQHALMLRFPSALEAWKQSKPGKVIGTEASTVIELYQSEDEVFRLAAWLKAKEEGKTDMEAGKIARRAFMDYNINAPWVQAMRNSVLPFVSYTYRAVPMMLEISAKKPHKLLKLMAIAGALNAFGVMLAGGGDDKERKLLPEEKAGRIWGMVPKLIRMPWNDTNGSPVYLDIRRFIPVGDVFDIGAGHSAVPILPMMQVGGPLNILAELKANKSDFTGKPIVLDTDTGLQKTAKVLDYLYKAAAPNVIGMPGTYATTGVLNAATGKTDAFGRQQSVAQALASSVGVKLGSYPADVLARNLHGQAQAKIMEIDKNITGLKRQRQMNGIDQSEFESKVKTEQEKKAKVMQELAEKLK